MKILIADDERMSCRLLESTLSGWGHEVLVTRDGAEAWAALQKDDAPRLAILDWIMPEMDGIELCRKAREKAATKSIYIVLLTARTEMDDLVAGLDAGANDYVAKPFNREELRARVQVGVRMIEMQQAMAADLADRKRAEKALQKTEEQLRQVQKLEAVGQLAGGIAHDFNNLLTVINGYSDITLRRLGAADPLRLPIQEIRKAGDRAALLTRQLLAFSRKQMLQPTVLDLNCLVTDMGKMLVRLIPESVEFVTLLRPEIGKINADPGQIEQVLMNLVVNARDAMPQGGKITIETSNVEIDEGFASQYESIHSGPHVMLSVSDTGCGIDAETQKHIFEPFFTTKDVDKGTGLGLSTVYGIVKQSDGAIWVDSQVGFGTTFKVYFPWHMFKAALPEDVPQPVVWLSGWETILLVEDDATVRKFTRDILEENGYKVLEAAQGVDALCISALHADHIHLVLTDVVMPQMSGSELAAALANQRPETPVLYMSGYTDDAIVHRSVQDSATHFLGKPFTAEKLSRMIRQILDTRTWPPTTDTPAPEFLIAVS